MLEKKTRAETEARLSVEKQLAELQAQKLEEAASTARSLTNRYLTPIKPFKFLDTEVALCLKSKAGSAVVCC